ncbi:glycosyltransferase [Arthrobacter sp. NPDC056727]|uniref:glycosyltransferase n=1 Tax=Arthrobacter sp. NPDC056727 TaxID=3345927 RepID=UPI00366F6754
MRITHVVAYVSKDGAFGGPTAVAVAQLEDLAAQGANVRLVAGSDGRSDLRTSVPRRFYPVLKFGGGFRAIFSPGLYRHMMGSWHQDDILHIHLGRDFVTMGVAMIARLRRIPFVVQTHGMIMPRHSVTFRVFDFLTTIPVLCAARRVYVLTNREKDAIEEISGGRANIEMLPNGIPQSVLGEGAHREANLVVFLARLHPRKRVLTFVKMCDILRQRGIDFRAEIFGPDEGDLAPMLASIGEKRLEQLVSYSGPVEQGAGIDVLSRAAVYVLPSVGEVYPMTVLEALTSRTAVVTTRDSGLAKLLTELDAALVTDGSPEQLANAVELVLEDESRRADLIRNGFAAVKNNFSIRAITSKLSEEYKIAASYK